MAITRRQIIITISVLYLAGLTVLAAYALHSAHVYSLPIADIICGLTLALPALAGVALETVISLNESLSRNGQLQTSRVFQVTVVAFLVFETVLATLAGTHISPPGSLNCALREQWERMFHEKDGESIKRIQDAFDCCGYNIPRDMAFPFPGDGRTADACMVRFDRENACSDAWRAEEQKVAIMLLIVPLAVFVWKVIIVLAPSSASAWLPSSIRLPSERASSRRLPAIEYRDNEDVVNENAIEESSDSLRAEVNRLNKDSNLASHIEGERRKSTGNLIRDSNFDVWRGDAEDR